MQRYLISFFVDERPACMILGLRKTLQMKLERQDQIKYLLAAIMFFFAGTFFIVEFVFKDYSSASFQWLSQFVKISDIDIIIDILAFKYRFKWQFFTLFISPYQSSDFRLAFCDRIGITSIIGIIYTSYESHKNCRFTLHENPVRHYYNGSN